MAISADDKRIFNIVEGIAEGQQVLERLAALIALRLWLPLWQQERVPLRVRADNYTVLAMVSRMKAASPQLRLISADMALVLTDSCYMPWVAEHTPGIQNVVADALSRRFEPGFNFILPPALEGATPCAPTARDEPWYRTRQAPTR